MDNLILITHNIALINDLKVKLLCRYKACNLRPVSFYLGIRILQDYPNCSLSIIIDSYVNYLIKEYYLTDALKVHNLLLKIALNLTKRKDKANNNLTN